MKRLLFLLASVMMLSVPYIHAEAQTPVTTVASRGVQDENQEPDGFPSLQELSNYSKVIKGYSSLAPRRSEGLNVPMPMALSPNTFTAYATWTAQRATVSWNYNRHTDMSAPMVVVGTGANVASGQSTSSLYDDRLGYDNSQPTLPSVHGWTFNGFSFTGNTGYYFGSNAVNSMSVTTNGGMPTTLLTLDGMSGGVNFNNYYFRFNDGTNAINVEGKGQWTRGSGTVTWSWNVPAGASSTVVHNNGGNTTSYDYDSPMNQTVPVPFVLGWTFNGWIVQERSIYYAGSDTASMSALGTVNSGQVTIGANKFLPGTTGLAYMNGSAPRQNVKINPGIEYRWNSNECKYTSDAANVTMTASYSANKVPIVLDYIGDLPKDTNTSPSNRIVTNADSSIWKEMSGKELSLPASDEYYGPTVKIKNDNKTEYIENNKSAYYYKTINFDTKIGSLPTPTLEGWDFKGWKVYAAGAGSQDIGTLNYNYNKGSSAKGSAWATDIVNADTWFRWNNGTVETGVVLVAQWAKHGSPGANTGHQDIRLTLKYDKPANSSSVLYYGNTAVTDALQNRDNSWTNTSVTSTQKMMLYDTKIGTVPIPYIIGWNFNGWWTEPLSGDNHYRKASDSITQASFLLKGTNSPGSSTTTPSTSADSRTGFGIGTNSVNVSDKYSFADGSNGIDASAKGYWSQQTGTLVLDFVGNLPSEAAYRPSHQMTIDSVAGWTAGNAGLIAKNATNVSGTAVTGASGLNSNVYYYHKSVTFDDKIISGDKLPVPSIEGWKFLGWKVYHTSDPGRTQSGSTKLYHIDVKSDAGSTKYQDNDVEQSDAFVTGADGKLYTNGRNGGGEDNTNTYGIGEVKGVSDKYFKDGGTETDYTYYRWNDGENITNVVLVAIWEPTGGKTTDPDIAETSDTDDIVLDLVYRRPTKDGVYLDATGNEQKYLDTASHSLVDSNLNGLVAGNSYAAMNEYKGNADKIDGHLYIKPVYDSPVSRARVFTTYNATTGDLTGELKHSVQEVWGTAKNGVSEPDLLGWSFQGWHMNNTRGFVTSVGSTAVDAKGLLSTTKWVWKYIDKNPYTAYPVFNQNKYTVTYDSYTATSGGSFDVTYYYDHVYKWPDVSKGQNFDGLRGSYGESSASNVTWSEQHAVKFSTHADATQIAAITEQYTFRGWLMNEDYSLETTGRYNRYSMACRNLLDNTLTWNNSAPNTYIDTSVYDAKSNVYAENLMTARTGLGSVVYKPDNIVSYDVLIGTQNRQDIGERKSDEDKKYVIGVKPDATFSNLVSKNGVKLQMLAVFESTGYDLPENPLRDGNMFIGWYDFKEDKASTAVDGHLAYDIDSWGTYYGNYGVHITGDYYGARHGIPAQGGLATDPNDGFNGVGGTAGSHGSYIMDASGRHKDITLYAWWNRKPVFVDVWDSVFYEGQRVTMTDLLSVTTSFDYEDDYYNAALAALYNIQNLSDAVKYDEIYQEVWVGKPHIDDVDGVGGDLEDESGVDGEIVETDPIVPMPEYDERAYASGVAEAVVDSEGVTHIYHLADDWIVYSGTITAGGETIKLYVNGDGKRYMTPADKYKYQSLIANTELIVDLYEIVYTKDGSNVDDSVDFFDMSSYPSVDPFALNPDDAGNRPYYIMSPYLIYQDVKHTFLSTATSRIVKDATKDEHEWRGYFDVTYVVTDSGLNIQWMQNGNTNTGGTGTDVTGSYSIGTLLPSGFDPLGTRAVVTYKRRGEIRYNDYPLIVGRNSIAPYDDEALSSPDKFEAWVKGNQFAIDYEDSISNVPWWYKSVTQRNLMNSIRIVGITSLQFDATFEANYPEICNKVRDTLEATTGYTNGLSNDSVYFCGLYSNTNMTGMSNGLSHYNKDGVLVDDFTWSEVMEHVQNFSVQYNCTDQWGKYATYEEDGTVVKNRHYEYPNDPDNPVPDPFEDLPYTPGDPDEDPHVYPGGHYPDFTIEIDTVPDPGTSDTPENPKDWIKVDPAPDPDDPDSPGGGGTGGGGIDPDNPPEVQPDDESTSTVVVVNPNIDSEMFKRNVEEKVRYINVRYLESMMSKDGIGGSEDNSYWGTKGIAGGGLEYLYDVLKLGFDVINEISESAGTPDSVLYYENGYWRRNNAQGGSGEVEINIYDEYRNNTVDGLAPDWEPNTSPTEPVH